MINRNRAREIAESLSRVDASIRPKWRDPLLVGYATGLIERHLDEVAKESTERARDQIKDLRARILQLEKERNARDDQA